MGTRLLTALVVTAAFVLGGCTPDGAGDEASTTSDPAQTTEPAGEAEDETATADAQEVDAPVVPVRPPDDTLTVGAEGIVCAVPQGWDLDNPPEDDGIVQASARGALPGDLLASVQVVTVPTERSSAERWTEEARTIGRVSDEWTFTLPTLSTRGPVTLLDLEHTGEDVRGWLLIFEHEDGRTYTVTLTAPVDDFDERHAAVILGTVRDA